LDVLQVDDGVFGKVLLRKKSVSLNKLHRRNGITFIHDTDEIQAFGP
jgi:hypothetical protein